MTTNDFDLNAISVRKPCHEDWDAMAGDDRARFCGKCEKKVYNLSEMTEHEAKALILEKRGDLCVQFYRRSDGTLATAQCPTGILGGPRRKLARAAAAAVAAGTMLAGSAFAGGGEQPVMAASDAAAQAAALRAQQSAQCQVTAVPETTVTYTVRAGETIADILAQWNSQEAWVRAANPDVDLATLTDGQKLKVPYAAPVTRGRVAIKGKIAPTPAPAAPTGRMIKGDMAAPTPPPAAAGGQVEMGEMIAPAPAAAPTPAADEAE